MIAREVICPYCTHKFMMLSDDTIKVISSKQILHYDECPECGSEIGVIEGEQTGYLIIGDNIMIDNQNKRIKRALKV